MRQVSLSLLPLSHLSIIPPLPHTPHNLNATEKRHACEASSLQI
jgi:hypothetical protein